ncbi:MAG TPA: hypothetical protein DCQ06_02340, partial [Myxococcales bacterium]|nr:hypothetical protein [Myxococcales bacterium]
MPVSESINALAIAAAPAKAEDTQGQMVVAQYDREKALADVELKGGALVMFVNASANSSPATFKVGSATAADVAFAAGAVDVATTKAVLAKADTDIRQTIEVTSGSATATLPNADMQGNRIHVVVFYGGDRVAVVSSKLSETGMRIFHGFPNQGEQGKNGAVSFSVGPQAEAGLNGVRSREALNYGDVSEYIHHTGNTWQPSLIRKGSRSDVTCMDVNGVGQCSGWKQALNADDRARRLTLKKEMTHTWVLCTNVWSGGQCKEGDKGNPAAMNDCRYWWTDDKGAEHNPCKDFVINHDKMKILGDSRFNYVYWITNPHASSPLGYGPSAADPDTGELFWGVAHIYGAPLISYGQYGRDMVDLLNGDLDTTDLVNGEHIREYLKKLNNDANDKSLSADAKFGDLPQQAVGAPVKPAKERATYRLSEMYKGMANAQAQEADMEKVHSWESPKELGKMLEKEGAFFNMDEVFSRMDKIRGTPLERAMINDEMALVMSEGKVQPGDQIPPEMLGKISPAGWAWSRREHDERKRMQLLGYNSIFLAEFTDPSLVTMAKRLKCQPGQTPTDEYTGDSIGDKACYKGDAITLALQNAIFRGVLEHEIGHCMGLRHNFSASADVLNYFEPYYSIREKEEVLCGDIISQFGVVTADNMCEDALGESCQLIQCTTDESCPSGLACNDGGNCVDANDTKMGRCVGSDEYMTPCTAADADDVCGAGGVCVDGTCGAKFACGADEDCLSGEGCISGYCQNVQTGGFRTTPAISTVNGPKKKFMPRPAPTASEIEKRRTEYQYASIMDYGQKINADFMGLGKYDKAAIRYGYGRLTDVFADMSYMRRQLNKYAKETSNTPEASSWRIDTGGWRFAGAITHPFMYLNNWMPPEYLNKRDSVPTHMVRTEVGLTEKYGRRVYDSTFFEVPYKYC